MTSVAQEIRRDREIADQVRIERDIATLMVEQKAAAAVTAAALEQIRTEVRAGNAESRQRFDAIDERLDRGDAKFDKIDAALEAKREAEEKEKIAQAHEKGKRAVWTWIGTKALVLFGSGFAMIASAVGWWISNHWPWLAQWLNPPPPSAGGH